MASVVLLAQNDPRGRFEIGGVAIEAPVVLLAGGDLSFNGEWSAAAAQAVREQVAKGVAFQGQGFAQANLDIVVFNLIEADTLNFDPMFGSWDIAP